MEPLDLHSVIRHAGGRWVGANPPPNALIAEIGTDTRLLSGEGLFVALQGEHRDGHAFVTEARRRGVLASIVAENRVSDLSQAGWPYIAVDDPLGALERLAAWNRRRLDPVVVGITGSVGKTSTKAFLETILSARFQVKAAPKSYNNRLGVALTLLATNPRTEILVVELATSAPGELAHLATIAAPGRIIVTEIAPAHLQGLRDLDGVVAAKAEVFEGFPADGQSFLRAGVYGFETLAQKSLLPPLTFGWEDADICVTDCRRVSLCGAGGASSSTAAYGYHFTINGEENFILPVPGRHNVMNAVAAISVARDLGMRWEEIRAALSLCRLPPQRLHVSEAAGVLLFDDSYNANPRSMEAAIEEWVSFGESEAGRRVAVLGDMLELGDATQALHREIGKRLAPKGDCVLVTVGEASRWIGEAFQEAGGGGESSHFSTAGDALPYLQRILRSGDRVLFKGSRRIGLDDTVRKLHHWLSQEARVAQTGM